MDDGYYMVPHPDKNKLPKTCIDEEQDSKMTLILN